MTLNQSKGEMSHEERCQRLKWLTLSDHRTYLSYVECYKIVFDYYHLNFEELFEFTTTESTRENHSYKLYVKSTRLNCYKHCFFFSLE